VSDGFDDRRASNGPPAEGEDERDLSMGELVLDISDRITVLVREEFELAKAEVSEKVNKLVQGSVAGVAAAIFVIGAIAMLMHAIAWLLAETVFDDTVWLGFLVEAVFWLLVAAGVGYFAYRSFQQGAPPTPDLAIEEAKRTRDAFEDVVEGIAADARGEEPAPTAAPATGTAAAGGSATPPESTATPGSTAKPESGTAPGTAASPGSGPDDNGGSSR
jgi:hypothetical protein